METLTVTRKRTVKVYGDHHAESPRQWSNLGTMVCWHSRYNLGDEQPKCTPVEYLINLLFEADRRAHYVLDEAYNRGRDVTDLLHAHIEKHFVVLPLYLYDHSGLTMSTRAFSCPWDSGQVGFIVCSIEDGRKEYGDDGDEVRARLTDYLRAEVSSYDAFLRGDVYGFEVVDQLIDEYGDVVDEEHVDSCWGFYETDGYPAVDAMREHVPPELHGALDDAMHRPIHR